MTSFDTLSVRLMLGGSLAALAATPTLAFAPQNDAQAAAVGDQAQVSEIVVTGSRVPRAGFTAPTPVTILGSDQLAKAAPSTVAESLRQLPALTNLRDLSGTPAQPRAARAS